MSEADRAPVYYRGTHLTLGMRKGLRSMHPGTPAPYPTIAGNPRTRLFQAKMLRMTKDNREMMELTNLGIEAREFLDTVGAP